MTQHTRPGARAKAQRREEAEARNLKTPEEKTRRFREGPPENRKK